MMMVVLPVLVPVLVLVSMLMVLMSMAMLAGLFVMVMMFFVYHSSVHFPSAKVRRSGCNRVAIVAGIG